MKKSRFRILVIGILGLLFLVGILIYTFKVWFMSNYGSGFQTVPNAILDVDRKFKFPSHFPPDPGVAGKRTIEGVDSDHDGVRDDVQRWIYAFVPDEPGKQMALRQMARYYQHSLQDGFSLEVRKVSHFLIDRAIQCMFRNFRDEIHGYREHIYLRAKMLNTYNRTVLYLENDQKITTEEMSGNRPDYEKPCDNH